MKAAFWQVDAFAEKRFAGNPAAVMLLPHWPEDGLMQQVAAENNLSETAFIVREPAGWRIRWFTPKVEVDLCGHATLAAGWVVLNHLEQGEQVVFASKSGALPVERQDQRLVLDFPAMPPRSTIFPDGIEAVLAKPVREVLSTSDHLLCVLDSADAVRSLVPNMAAVAGLNKRALIVTAPGDRDQGGDCDFVSRFFAPRKGVIEDPVTGSAHCVLTPFWAKRLGQDAMVARQLSARGGILWVEQAGPRVRIAGHVVPYVNGAAEI
ncbi:PhzF family phenazine biosynthesis protein [Magnetospirillum sulfuroxidans]|uniref:PhzF family phenazine biosynthesis protein n=1 Tax=Magnetospirillum sulfuroxidans TaxID=611300 RepID=A0ABS5ICL0_9PROT|nr:PhzF family phenazine biosynthesis protein [Magnetospirillum sulfuroxidans]MBR9972160.1 PhzF family phenazine biosynthesis protein [Magnetospirillum sulfuroxidans]